VYRVVAPVAGRYRQAVSTSRAVRLIVNGVAAKLRSGTVRYRPTQVASVSAVPGGHRVRLASRVPAADVGTTILVPTTTGAPSGLVDVVTSRSNDGGRWILTTRRGSLATAFSDLTVTRRLTGLGPAAATASTTSAAGGARLGLLTAPTVTCAVGSARPTIKPTVNTSGVTMDVVMNLKSRRMSVRLSGPVTMSWAASAEGKLSCSIAWALVRKQIGSVFYVPIMLAVGPKLTLSANGTFTASMSASTKLDAGLEVNGSKVTFSGGFTSPAVSPPVIGASSHVSLAGGVALKISVAELVGLEGTAAYKATATSRSGMAPDPCTEVSGALNAELAAVGRAFGVVGWSFTLASKDWFSRQIWTNCSPKASGGQATLTLLRDHAPPGSGVTAIASCPVAPAGFYAVGMQQLDGVDNAFSSFDADTAALSPPGFWTRSAYVLLVGGRGVHQIRLRCLAAADPLHPEEATQLAVTNSVTFYSTDPTPVFNVTPAAIAVGGSVTVSGTCMASTTGTSGSVDLSVGIPGTDAYSARTVGASENGAFGPASLTAPSAIPPPGSSYSVGILCNLRSTTGSYWIVMWSAWVPVSIV
jgi:hypothetical protein